MPRFWIALKQFVCTNTKVENFDRKCNGVVWNRAVKYCFDVIIHLVRKPNGACAITTEWVVTQWLFAVTLKSRKATVSSNNENTDQHHHNYVLFTITDLQPGQIRRKKEIISSLKNKQNTPKKFSNVKIWGIHFEQLGDV